LDEVQPILTGWLISIHVQFMVKLLTEPRESASAARLASGP
jgi:hypothetical protein